MKTLINNAKRPLLLILIVILLLFALIWGETLRLQQKHYRAGVRYATESNPKLAIREYDIAMHLYAPFSPYNKKTAESLWEIGETLEQQGQVEQALTTFGAIRSAVYATGSLYPDSNNWKARCNEKIASLSTTVMIEKDYLAPDAEKEEKDLFLNTLQTTHGPNNIWAFISIIAFSCWVLSCTMLTFKWQKRTTLSFFKNNSFGIISFILAYALWVLALLKT